MANTIFEEMGGTYVRQGDYLIPYLTLPAEKENKPIGLWGQWHRYLKQNCRVLYINLLTSGRLNAHLAEIDKQAQDVSSAGRADDRARVCDRTTQDRKSNGVGCPNEQHS